MPPAVCWTWLLGGLSVTGAWLAGRHRVGWLISLAAEWLWAVYAVWTRQYGFLLMTAAYTATYLRNWRIAGK